MRRLLAAILLLAAACGGPDAPPQAAGPTVVRMHMRHDGASTGLEVGQVLRVDLPAEPELGRFWSLVSVDTAVLVPHGDDQLLSTWDGPGHEEATSTSIFRFAAVAPGSATLRLRYAPFPDGPEEPPALETFTLRVAVGGARR